MGSSRLPNKVLMPVEDKTILEHVIDRVSKSKLLDDIIVATTILKEDLKIVEVCCKRGIRVYCGSENDVLDRYYQIAKLIDVDNIIRITADCPLHDANIIDNVILTHIKENSDYTSNILDETFPDGLDCEVMTYKVLTEAWEKSTMASEREHVTRYIIQHDKFKKTSVLDKDNHGNQRWTLDIDKDYLFIKRVYKELYYKNPYFNYYDILALLEKSPEIQLINQGIKRNEGTQKSIEHDYKML